MVANRSSVGEVFEGACRRLKLAGIAEARLEARVMTGSALGVGETAVLGRPEAAVGAGEAERLKAMVERRVRREPLAQILETREFWSLSFHVTKDTLIPRPDSETIVEAALAWAGGRDDVAAILDLGTGSGCLLLSLLHELKEARGLGVDISAAALKVAAENARSLGLEDRARFVKGDWGDGLKETFDMIVINPPYIPENDIAGLAPEVSLFEPRLALSGGADGLYCYRAVIPWLPQLLAPSGRAFIEVGKEQFSAVADLLEEHGLQPVDVIKDLSGIERCVTALGGKEN